MSILTPIPHRNSPAQNNSGFTLIELMISLAITAILLAMAVPAMFDFLERNQSRAIISEVRNLVALARENAVHHGCNTVMCPSEDQIQCTRNMGAPAIVFSDCNENRQIDGNDQLYRVMRSLPENSQLRWSFSGNQRLVEMTPQGYTDSIFGNILYCPASGEEKHARLLIIFRTGRARYGKDTDGDGVPNHPTRGNVEC